MGDATYDKDTNPGKVSWIPAKKDLRVSMAGDVEACSTRQRQDASRKRQYIDKTIEKRRWIFNNSLEFRNILRQLTWEAVLNSLDVV